MPSAPPIASLRALEGARAGDDGAWRWAVEARLSAPVSARSLRALLSGAWVAEAGATRAIARLSAPRAGRSAQVALEQADESTLCDGVLVEWDLLSPVAAPPVAPLEPGRWVIVRARADDADGIPDEAAFQQRLDMTQAILAPVRPRLVAPSLPPAIAADRARALHRLRRAWDSRLLIRLLAPGQGWVPSEVWGLLTTKLGMSALPDARLGFVPADGDAPIFEARGWDGGEVVHHGAPRAADRVQGLELAFKPATQAQPEAVLSALLEVAAYLQAELGGVLLDEEEEALEERLLREGVRVVIAGLAAHGLRPGAGPMRLLAPRPQVQPPALKVARRA